MVLLVAAISGVTLSGCGQSGGTVGISGPANGACLNCGPANLVVPNVVDQTLVLADRALANSHLICRSKASVDSQPVGTVISEDPTAGTRVRQYTTVTLGYAVSQTTPAAIGNGCAIGFSTVP